MSAQNAATMTMSELEQAAISRVSEQQFVAARPFLEELVKRISQAEGAQKNSLEGLYFYLGVGYLVEYSGNPSDNLLTSGIDWFQRMLKEFPNGGFAVLGSLAMADAYRGLQKWTDAANTYVKVLSPPLEFELSNKQRLEALKKLSQSYYIERNWKDGTKWFLIFLKEAQDPDDQAMAAAALMEAFISESKFDEAIELFPMLVGESPSRYGLQLNIALIEAGDRLADKKRYSEAMLMYRMVITLENILKWQNDRLIGLKEQLDLLKLTTGTESERAIELETDIFNIEQQLKALSEIKSYTPELRVRIARNYLLTSRDWESFYAYLELINDYPDNPALEDFVYAAFTGATNIGLSTEVIKLGETYLNDNGWAKYRSDIILKTAQYYLEESQVEEFFSLAERFIEKNPNDRYASQMLFMMGTAYVRLEDFSGMIQQFKEYDEKYPNTGMTDGLKYWLGMAYMFEQDYEKAGQNFEVVINKYKSSAYYEDALYRYGICQMGVQNFAAARESFESILKQFPNSNLRGEVEFFLGDVEAAEPNVEKALKHYANVEKYSENVGFIQNAYFQTGELLEANKRYEEMADNFRQYINKYRDRGELTGAIYQLGRALELQGKPGEMLKEYWIAIERFGNVPRAYGLDTILVEYPKRYNYNKDRIDANLEFLEKVSTEADFRIQMAKDRNVLFVYLAEHPDITEDVKRPFYDAAFRAAVVKDLAPVEEMMKEYRAMQTDMPVETPEELFLSGYNRANAAQERTLALRLQKGLYDMGNNINPGQVFTEEDFQYGSPITLIWMGDLNRQFDPQLARTAYQEVVQKHSGSESVLDALLALGDLEMSQGNYDQAIAYFQMAQDNYPTDPKLVYAVMSQGDAKLKQGKYAEAREIYDSITTNRSWRGAPHAEALYKIGNSYYEEGNLETAQAYYQRTYIGHSAFTEWAGAAYFKSGQSLERMGKAEEAKSTYDEFLEVPEYNGTKYYSDIKNAREAL